MSIKDIANEILQLESEIAAKQKTLAQAEAKLQETIQDKVTAELATKDYGCGIVNIVEDDIKIKVVVSKRSNGTIANLSAFTMTSKKAVQMQAHI